MTDRIRGPSSPFTTRIDSSVEHADGYWFSSEKWAIKIRKDKSDFKPIKPCRHFGCPVYWEALVKSRHFEYGFTSNAQAPGGGFWIFGGGSYCVRVDDYGKIIKEGPDEMQKIWPKLKGKDYDFSEIVACTRVAKPSSSSDSYLFFNRVVEADPDISKYLVLTYHRFPERKDDTVEGPVQVVKMFPALENYPDFVQDISSLLDDGDGGYHFFSGERACRWLKDGTLDPAPGTIEDQWPALADADCKEGCD